jgi:hypothetical protein
MPQANADDPLRTTDQEPSAATPGRDVTTDDAPASSVADGRTGPYVPSEAAEHQGAEPERAAASVSVGGATRTGARAPEVDGTHCRGLGAL